MHRARSIEPERPPLRYVAVSGVSFLLAVATVAVGACDREGMPDEGPAAAAAAVDTPLAGPGASDEAARPNEIFFNLSAFAWYREGRPLMHEGRSYMPQSDPIPVEGELREAGTYEGVTYYVPEDASEPVYTLYVPVYYRYWQRFTAPPGA